MKAKLFSYSLLFVILIPAFSQNTVLKNDNWELSLKNNGTMESLAFNGTNHKVAFLNNEFAGPSWYFQMDDEVIVPSNNYLKDYKAITSYDFLNLSIEYKDDDGKLMILATIKNTGHTPFQPVKLGLRLGIDTYMEKYPDWNDKLFPTLLRCESTHFWGYFMSPAGKILVIASPDAIASWSHEYTKSWGYPPYQFIGHRITSVNLDLINTLPLPERHPQNLWQLKPGETKKFRIYLDEVAKLTDVTDKVAKLTGAPMIDIAATSCEKNQIVRFSVNSQDDCETEIYMPDGSLLTPELISKTNHQLSYTFNTTELEGLYSIKTVSENGKVSKASFYVRKPYSWYMQQAMKAVIDYPQKASKSHCESWYGFNTAFLGGKYFPDNEYIKKANKQFQIIYPAVFDTVRFEPFAIKHRIQNVSAMISILVDRYQLFHNMNDLHHAINLSEYILRAQTPDGAYRSGNTHYTSVLYIAKALMELLEAIEPFKDEAEYKEQYKKISVSVKSAIDELERNRSNVQTEGELTFEDGMIACSALQLGYFALKQSSKKEREKYTDAALDILKQHDCLEQLVIPDARMRSATLRFWEAQYDVLMDNNFFNSPHGWSSWTTYANYYAYLLTGDTKYLIRTFNGLDAAMQTINIDNGKVYWAFMVNPYVEVTQIKRNMDGATPLNFPGIHYHARQYPNDQYIMGEQYVDMVSDWFFANANDSDIHEHFKCLDEVALSKAYLAEDEDGNLITYNCKAKKDGSKIIIEPSENLVDKLHVNLYKDNEITIIFANRTLVRKIGKGMTWISQ